MDQIKIGRFIAERRKAQGLTQAQLAEKLLVTDRAVSKWENARSMPDSSIMLELCEILDITVNELLTGERIEMKDYAKEAELNLIRMKKEKERSDKRLLNIEIVLFIITIIAVVGLSLFAGFYGERFPKEVWVPITMISIAFSIIIVAVVAGIIIEVKAGYYKCRACGKTFIPTTSQGVWSMHMMRTRYIKCPHCQQRSWAKKVVAEETAE